MNFRKIFDVAVAGDTSDVLGKILEPDIALAVWENPLAAGTHRYLDALDMSKPFNGESSGSYYSHFSDAVFDQYSGVEAIQTLAAPLPDGTGKDALVRDIHAFKSAFLSATQATKVRAHLSRFRPREATGKLDAGGFWHYDGGMHIGIITLKGDRGTLVRPKNSINPEEKSFEKVIPEEQPFISELRPRDFALFTAIASGKPLYHATPPYPMTKQDRLVLLLDNPR